MSDKDERCQSDPYRCPYCGSNLILDYQTHAYVCPVCGTVCEYEMVPSYVQLQHSAPLDEHYISQKLEDEVIERANVLFGEKIAKEIRRIAREKSEEVLEALEAIVKKKKYKVSWKAIRTAIEIANKYNLPINLDAIREEEVKEKIKEIIEREELPTTPNEVYMFALKYKNLWSGRKTATIAAIFTYIYVKRKLGIEIRVKPRLKKIIKLLEKVINERETT